MPTSSLKHWLLKFRFDQIHPTKVTRLLLIPVFLCPTSSHTSFSPKISTTSRTNRSYAIKFTAAQQVLNTSWSFLIACIVIELEMDLKRVCVIIRCPTNLMGDPLHMLACFLFMYSHFPSYRNISKKKMTLQFKGQVFNYINKNKTEKCNTSSKYSLIKIRHLLDQKYDIFFRPRLYFPSCLCMVLFFLFFFIMFSLLQSMHVLQARKLYSS